MLYLILGQIPMNYELQIDQFQSSMTNTLLFGHRNMISLIQHFIKVTIQQELENYISDIFFRSLKIVPFLTKVSLHFILQI